MKKFIITTILILSTIASVFAEERIEYFGNFALLYDTEWTAENYSCTREGLIDEIKAKQSDFQEKTIFGVFLTEEDIQLFRKLGIPLIKAMKPSEDYKAEHTKTDLGKALYRAEELALHGILGVTLWQKGQNDDWIRVAFVFYKSCESGVAGAVKYFTVLLKESK